MRQTRSEMRHHDLITIRRYKVLEYLSTGHLSHREIANKLNVSADTVDRDVKFLTDTSDADIRNHFKSLPLEIKKCKTLLELTIRQLTEIIDKEGIDLAHRQAAINSRMQAVRFKLELWDGAAHLEEVFGFIDQEREQHGKGSTPQKGKVTHDAIQ